MGLLFEGRSISLSNETAGEHFTPREVKYVLPGSGQLYSALRVKYFVR
jgi:hypothetical protein